MATRQVIQPGKGAEPDWRVMRGQDVDPVRWARLLRRAHERAMSEGEPPPILRELVASSWRRAARAGVDPDRPAPKVLDSADAARLLADHPVSHLLPVIESLLAEATEDARYFAALSDADGLLLWAGGQPRALEISVAPRFLPGHLASENAVGTNAIGTALALDRPVQIFSAEHFNRLLHGWTCSAAPIHDPESGGILAVLDLSGRFQGGYALSLSLVSAVARVVEQKLSEELAQRDERLKALYLERVAGRSNERSALVSRTGRVLAACPRGWAGTSRVDLPDDGASVTLPNGLVVSAESIGEGGAQILAPVGRRRPTLRKPRLHLETLGRRRVRVSLRGERFELTPRQSEIALMMIICPQGLSSSELGHELYGADCNRITVRAEMSRLRQGLGPLLAKQPYRFNAEVGADFLELHDLLDRGEVLAAIDRYRGAVLPASEVEAIVRLRRRTEEALRSCVQIRDDPDLLYTWIQTEAGQDDLSAHQSLLRLLDDRDVRRALVAVRIGELAAEADSATGKRGWR